MLSTALSGPLGGCVLCEGVGRPSAWQPGQFGFSTVEWKSQLLKADERSLLSACPLPLRNHQQLEIVKLE